MIVHLPNYRNYILSNLPTLLALDFTISTQEERQGYFPKVTAANKVWIQDTTDLFIFKQHIYKLKRKWERCSPSIRIQSLWRRYRTNIRRGTHMTDRDIHAIKIQKIVRGWLLRNKLQRDLEEMLRSTNNEHLLFNPEDYIDYLAVKNIENFVKDRFLPRKWRFERRTKAAILIQKIYKRWITQKRGYPFLDSSKLFVLKSEQRTLICLLKVLSKISQEYHPANSVEDRMAPEFFEKLERPIEGFEFSWLYSQISECESVKVIRFPDIENLQFSTIPYFQFSSWIFHSKIANNQGGTSIEEFKVSEHYKHKHELELLNKLVPRIGKFTTEEKAKFDSMELVLDDYLDLVEFKSPSIEFTNKLFRLILEYNYYVNSKELPIFLPIYSKFLDRVRAACTIQAGWRSYQNIQGLNLIKEAINRRAAICIERWWRFLIFYRRMLFLNKLKEILMDISTPVVYLHEHFFEHLKTSSKNALTIPEQEFDYYCKPEGLFVSYQNKRHPLLPNWVGASLREDFNSGGSSVAEEEKTLQAVVLSGARIEVVSLFNETENKSKVADASLKFIKLEYSSVEEARSRAAVVFLKTLDHHSNSFIPFFTIKNLEHPFLMTELRKIWGPRLIDPKLPAPAVEILEKALEPPIIESQTIIPSAREEEIEDRFTYMESKEESIATPIQSESAPSISNREIAQERVKEIRESVKRRQIERKLAKEISNVTKIESAKEEKEVNSELRSIRASQEMREKELRRSFVMAEKRKRMYLNEEREFVNKFAEARNMLEKLTKRSDMDRWRHKSTEDIINKVKDFKQKSEERRELVQSILYEKFKAKHYHNNL